jgi:hypothetical protein
VLLYTDVNVSCLCQRQNWSVMNKMRRSLLLATGTSLYSKDLESQVRGVEIVVDFS